MATLDEMWSAVVKARAFNTCQRCGVRIADEKDGLNTMANDPHHIFGRWKLSTRYDADNGVCLCRECHNWAGDHPEECMIWITRLKGPAWVQALRVRSLTILTPQQQAEQEERLRKEYEAIKRGQ